MVGKPFVPKYLHPWEKNHLYHSYALKTAQQHPLHVNTLRFRKKSTVAAQTDSEKVSTKDSTEVQGDEEDGEKLFAAEGLGDDIGDLETFGACGKGDKEEGGSKKFVFKDELDMPDCARMDVDKTADPENKAASPGGDSGGTDSKSASQAGSHCDVLTVHSAKPQNLQPDSNTSKPKGRVSNKQSNIEGKTSGIASVNNTTADPCEVMANANANLEAETFGKSLTTTSACGSKTSEGCLSGEKTRATTSKVTEKVASGSVEDSFVEQDHVSDSEDDLVIDVQSPVAPGGHSPVRRLTRAARKQQLLLELHEELGHPSSDSPMSPNHEVHDDCPQSPDVGGNMTEVDLNGPLVNARSAGSNAGPVEEWLPHTPFQCKPIVIPVEKVDSSPEVSEKDKEGTHCVRDTRSADMNNSGKDATIADESSATQTVSSSAGESCHGGSRQTLIQSADDNRTESSEPDQADTSMPIQGARCQRALRSRNTSSGKT